MLPSHSSHLFTSHLSVTGKDTGLLYATSPAFEGFFTTAEQLKAERGELADAGVAGWAELSPQVNYVKFNMVPEGYYKVLTQDDLGLLQMFHLSGIIDADIPDARLI